jgi:hypothetical protein
MAGLAARVFAEDRPSKALSRAGQEDVWPQGVEMRGLDMRGMRDLRRIARQS